MKRVFHRLAEVWGWLTLTRYIPGKLGKARHNELTAADFAPAKPEEHWVRRNAELWIARRPVSMRDAAACCKRHIMAGVAVGTAAYALMLLSIYFFFQILSRFLGDPTQPLWFGWVIITTMLLNNVVSNFLVALMGTFSIEVGSSMKAGMEALVFRASQNLKNAEDTGMVNTLISNDADRIFAMGQFLAWTVASALMLVASMVLTCVLMGWPAVPGLVLIVLVMFSARLLGTRSGKIRFGVLPHTDKRIGLISELLQSIFFVKMYVYEDHFWSRICEERNMEVKKLTQAGVVQAATFLSVNAASYIPSALSMIIYIAAGGLLTPSIAFTALSLYFGLWFPMIMFSYGLARIGQAAPCFTRLGALLAKEQIGPRDDWTKETANPSLSLKDCTFRFSKPLDPAAAAPFEVRNVTLEARAPSMVMLCGPVGSGKTTTLLGILGQLDRVSGQTALAGTIGVAGQTPFILNATLRDNVLFGSPMDEARYAQCLKTACLEADLRQLSDGEFTVIGEKGVNLSGGQKQRVSVARALYSGAQVLILDDVLSALDALVQREFFTGLMNFCRANGKLVVFANHHLHFAEHFDEVLVLQTKTEGDHRWGEQVERGSYAELMARPDGVFAALIKD
jgi:ATP-binding cassette subfamily C (CFTR/MRP) protein 1